MTNFERGAGVDIIPVTGGIANWYLLRAEGGWVMVDCGSVLNRGRLRRVLRKNGCRPGDVKLVVVTHADFDHAGNCAWLQREFKAPIALHPAELPAVTGTMFDSRARRVGPWLRGVMKVLGWCFARPFVPDVLLDEETDLREHGLDARVLFLPGHSQGSVGVLAADGDLCCGDLLNNSRGTPVKNWLVDVPEEMDASVRRLAALGVRTVYPGHGKPFKWADFMRA
jgi:hydroxyacylglutathione hydrolase